VAFSSLFFPYLKYFLAPNSTCETQKRFSSIFSTLGNGYQSQRLLEDKEKA